MPQQEKKTAKKMENERRKKTRFAIQREVQYKVLDGDVLAEAGTGKTFDMSSSGVAFSVERHIKLGDFVQLSIAWPALLNKTCPMRLVVFGRVVRCGSHKCVCSVDKYEFRTQARSLATVAPIRKDSLLERWAENAARRESVKTGAASAPTVINVRAAAACR